MRRTPWGPTGEGAQKIAIKRSWHTKTVTAAGPRRSETERFCQKDGLITSSAAVASDQAPRRERETAARTMIE